MGNRMVYRESDFVADGALRDVSVLDTELVDWQRMFDAIAELPGDASFATDAAGDFGDPRHLDAEKVFDALNLDEDASARLDININELWFACYFFDVSEIEFTFDPDDIRSAGDFEAVEKFITWLGRACGKRVVMTMEGTDHRTMPALLEFNP